MRLSARVDEVMQLDPSANAVWDAGHWWAWQAVSAMRQAIGDELNARGLPAGAPVGLVARTRYGPVAATLSLIAAERPIVPFNPMLGDTQLAADVRQAHLSLILAEPEDWSRPEILEAAGPAAVALTPGGSHPVSRLAQPAALTPAGIQTSPETAVWMLTSGTTGPPKRIPIRFAELDHMLDAVGHYSDSVRRAQSGRTLHRRPVIVASPLVHSSGFGGLLRAVAEGRPVALLERFSAEAWSSMVEFFESAAAALVPATLRMILDAGIPAARLRSLKAITVGTAPLDPELADEFEARYAVPLLPNYGATEFPGGLAAGRWQTDVSSGLPSAAASDHRTQGSASASLTQAVAVTWRRER